MATTTARAVLEGYTQLRRQVAIMLELARAGEWDVLIERQSGYLQLADRLRELDKSAELDDEGVQRKAELLESILADDLAIREQLLARRNELGQLMDSSRRQRDLHRSYGKQASSVVSSADDFGQGIS
ncbi:flagellar protein FliT [Halomonas sp. ANAO-440]|uniref:flagellar protein FliT n=1 Tax=Halomonas sp. ANAO-440 TaxID=2861360 RepID=UPI001CAA7F4D|nr:flagellar protein FliT [Halomonas sp. ANAO-440]MBZ0331732.1 flagellar protein FliT [Halomonas sp. ANAO-440]